MRVLVACEFSGRVRDAFAAVGHDAWSCDVLPTRSPGQHIQDDVLRHVADGWDMMIAFPPCTYLCRSGYNALAKLRSQRAPARAMALEFVRALWAAPIPHVCIENPSGLEDIWLPPSQHIEPWAFGHPFTKRTHLWLRGLPPLLATRIVSPQRSWTRSVPQQATEAERKLKRSLTFPGIAAAMAEQWGAWPCV